MNERAPWTREMKLFPPDEAIEMGEMHAIDGMAGISAGDALEGEYRQIVSAFHGIVRLHVASLSKVLDIVGSGSFEEFEEKAGRAGVATDMPTPPKSNVMNLIGNARTLAQAVVEGKMGMRAQPVKDRFRTPLNHGEPNDATRPN